MAVNEVSPNVAPLFEIVTRDELTNLRDAFTGARPHPLSALLGDLQHPSQTATNTGLAAQYVLDYDSAWASGIKKRILDQTDPGNAASALAELRAYGGLLEAGFKVKPGTGKGKPKPEFQVDPGDGGEVIVEVHAKQIDAAVQTKLDQHQSDTKAALDEFRAKLRKEGKPGGVFVGEPASITPFGEPHADKVGDTVTANAISRLCAIKASEHQLGDNIANALWFDLQDDYSWNLALDPNAAQPVSSWRGVMVSGALWYALYGWKGGPIMEFASSGEIRQKVTPMGHMGRFNQETKLSAVIAAFPKATVILENPAPVTQFTNMFRTTAMRLPWARAELSLCSWEPGLVASMVQAQKALILATATAVEENYDAGNPE